MSELWLPPSFDRQSVQGALSAFGRREGEDPVVAEMRANRAVNRRRAAAIERQASYGGGDLSLATVRPRDPMFYWKQNNLPFDFKKPEELRKLRTYCQMLYLTHPVIGSAIDIYCLAAETKVVTRGGVKPISALSGEVETVITKGGKWVDAKFDLMGVDHLRKVTVTRYGVTKEIFATPTHRWFTEKKHYRKNQIATQEVITDDLLPGMELVTTTPWRNELKKTNPSPFGVAHGFVVGDGTREANGGCVADLHGEKDLAALRYFNGATTHVYRQADGPTTRVYGLPGYYKDLPSLDESASYLSGWLAGYFLADGTINTQGQCFIDSVELANLEFVRDVCTRLGVVTYPIYDIGERQATAPDGVTRPLRMYRINIDSFDLNEEFFIGDEHRRRWVAAIGGRDRELRRSNWRVVSVEDTDRFEPVYCAVVPDTESFVIEDFILTGNSKFPLTGMELQCEDSKITQFYTDLFFDQLNYEDFLVDVGRQYWTVGEAWPLGSFNELLGVWEDDELINPDDVEVIRSPFSKEPRFMMKLPEEIRTVLSTRQPAWEYDALIRAYPELAAFASYTDKALMPVSSILLRQVQYRSDVFNPRGIPLLTRGLRAVMQEEMLNAAQDAIADRLYTPLILVKLGASASDLGTQVPWIPTPGDLAAFEDALDAALAGDFRVLTHHFAVEMTSVFGKENMPNFDADFERLTERQLQVFGLSKTMLSGAGCLTGETIVHVRRAGKGFRMRLADLVARFNGTDGNLPGRRWDPSIPTYVGQAHGRVVRSGLLDAAWSSGVKEVFLLTTKAGRQIRASATHPFLTEDGRWVELQDLKVGDVLQVNDARDFERRNAPSKPHYRSVGVKHHPHQISRGTRNGQTRYTVPLHRLVVEAALNDMQLYEIRAILNNDLLRSKELVFLPESVHVHHLDHNPQNNALENLQVLTHREHVAHHLAHGGSNFVMWRVGIDTIASIEPQGEEETFDLRMAESPHNFIANGFVVHNSGETYAADALNRDLVSQLLTTYQRVIKRHYRDRALVVAEAQGHYEREYKGGVPYPVLEEVLVVDEETGEQRIEERPKLLIPELNIRAMNMSDEKEERQLVEALRASGVPISMRRRLVNIPIDLEEEEKAIAEEQIRQVVAAQEVRRDTYLALRSKGLPIPQDLRDDFEPRAIMPGGPDAPAADQQPLPGMGLVEPADTAALAPTPADNDLAIQNGGGSQPGGQPQATPPMAQVVPFRPRNINGVPRRPPESDEQRDGMPKASSLQQPADALPGLAGPRFRKVTMRADRPLDDQLEDLRRSAPLRADGA